MPKLLIKAGNEIVKEIVLTKDTFSVGRMPDNDLELRDSLVSRRHSEFIKRGNKYTLYDLGSSNGTFVNNKKVDVKVLEEGDEVLIGETLIIFKDDSAAPKPHTGPNAPPQARDKSDEDLIASMYGGSEIIKHINDLPEQFKVDVRESIAKGISWKDISRQGTAPGKEATPTGKEATPAPAPGDKYFVLYKFGTVVASPTTSLEQALDESMKCIFDIISAERGVIMVFDKERGELIPRVTRHRVAGRIAHEEVVVSRTITNKVISEKVSIITSDAKYDPRFQAGVSIIQYNIRSALCVPLWEKQEVFGVIYVDNLLKAHAFQEDDLDLLTAIANQIAIRIKQEQLYEDLKREALIRENLERYNDPDVVEMILSKGKALLEVDEREVTVMFIDIESFTRMSEQLRPPQVAELLNGYFESMSKIIFKHQGSVNKFIGDGILAVFGAPISYPDHAVRAVRAALGMIQEAQRMSERSNLRYNIKIAINSGEVVAGNIGFAKRMEYTVLGDTVNVSARIEKLCKTNQILIGENTYDAVKDLFETKFLGSEKLRGKEKEVKVYQVLG
ncbi:MAG: FHA domain-containing protein [Planctomycetes bacterium]|nr:FHA domain-containing protein [Planctomycetota bacterium]